MTTPQISRRRRLAGGLALLTLVALPGCGGSDNQGAGAGSASTPSSVSASPTTDPTTTTTAPAAPSSGAPGTTPATSPPTTQLVGGTPARVIIPAIGVDAPTTDLNLNEDGTLEVPDWQDTGWWRRGPKPGGRGPAVIVGHVDSKTGPAVFYNLRDLKQGDIVEVALDEGGSVKYAVDRIERYPKDEFPTEAVYALTDDSQLRLITCDGWFDRSSGHYQDNLVVYAVAV